MSWVYHIAKKARKVYSQGKQDGVLEFIFQNIKPSEKLCVEFGFNASTLCGGSGSNCANLILNHGWTGVLFDGDYENKDINLHREFLTTDSVCSTFAKYHIPQDFGYLSIDVDSTDLWLLSVLLDGGYRPQVISCEYNPNFHLSEMITCPGDKDLRWEGDRVYGASLGALDCVMFANDYKLVYVEPCLDGFWIRKDLIPDYKADYRRFMNYTAVECHRPCTSQKYKIMLDYGVWLATGDVDLAQEAAWPVTKRRIAI